jgi:hypothetical protein
MRNAITLVSVMSVVGCGGSSTPLGDPTPDAGSPTVTNGTTTPPAVMGCTTDNDCKGARICVDTKCIDMDAQAAPIQPAQFVPPTSLSCSATNGSSNACGDSPGAYTYVLSDQAVTVGYQGQIVTVPCVFNSSNTLQCMLTAVWHGNPNRIVTFAYDPVTRELTVTMTNPDAPTAPCTWTEPC